MISFDQRFVVPRNVLVREVDGEAVILNVESERYFGLDDIGTRMWSVLTSAGSAQEAYDRLLTMYDIDPETLRQDLTELIETLMAHHLLEPTHE
jgi:hypothetical protein